MFFEQLTKICKEKNIKITPLLLKLGMSKGNIEKWRNGMTPNGESLIKLANELNVSVDYLLGRPEQKWFCDVCGRVIDNPKKGYVVWKYGDDHEEEGHFEYKILHPRKLLDENGEKYGCDFDRTYGYSSSLVDFLGVEGLVKLLAMLDPGPLHRVHYKERIKNIRDFLELFRRVQLPYYEEARLYLDAAYNDGYLGGANEIATYLPSTLKDIIDEYKDTN